MEKTIKPTGDIKIIDSKLRQLGIKTTIIFDITGGQDGFICKLFLPDRTLEIKHTSYQQLLISTEIVLSAIIKQGQAFIN